MQLVDNDSDQTTPAEELTYFVLIVRHLRESWFIWLLGLVFVGGATGIFLELAGDVWAKEAFPWDAPLMLAIHQFSRPWLDTLMITITNIGFPGALVIAPTAAIWLWWRRQQRVAAIALIVSIVGSALLSSLLKVLFARPRPAVFPPLTPETTYSFPSGHALAAVALFGFAAYLLWQQKQRIWAVFVVLFALLVSFSRIYLGVHYPSDVLGSLSLGLLWLAVVIGGYRYYQARTVPTGKDESTTLPPSKISV